MMMVVMMMMMRRAHHPGGPESTPHGPGLAAWVGASTGRRRVPRALGTRLIDRLDVVDACPLCNGWVRIFVN